jgi:hypothetical protein
MAKKRSRGSARKINGMHWGKWIGFTVVVFLLVALVFGPIQTNVSDIAYVGTYPIALRYALEITVLSVIVAMTGYLITRNR